MGDSSTGRQTDDIMGRGTAKKKDQKPSLHLQLHLNGSNFVRISSPDLLVFSGWEPSSVSLHTVFKQLPMRSLQMIICTLVSYLQPSLQLLVSSHTTKNQNLLPLWNLSRISFLNMPFADVMETKSPLPPLS